MRWGLAIIVALAAAAALWFFVDRSEIRPAAPADLDPPRPVAHLPALPAELVSGDGMIITWAQHTAARFEPCGCVAGMFGGLLRRAPLHQRIDDERLLAIEGGGWSAGDKDFQLIKTHHYLRTAAASGVRVAGLGGREVALGADVLRDLLATAQTAGLPVACANLQADGEQVGHALVDLTVAGTRVAITGVVPADAVGPGLHVVDPVAALTALLPHLDGRPLIVLADLNEEGLAALARAVPGIAVVIGGAVKTPSDPPLRIGATTVLHAGNEGKTIGWWPWGSDRIHFELLADTLPEDPAVRAAIGRYQEALGAADLAIDAPGGGGLTAIGTRHATYLGSQTCMGCHQDAHAVHAASRHFHSYDALVTKGYHRDPECLACHVTGLGKPSGFTRQTAADHLRQVSCESCHGPGSVHIAAGGQGGLVAVTPATCITCHDTENSPAFTYDTYWPRIHHGR